MLTADLFDDPLPEQISPEFGQRPPAIAQAELLWRLVGDAAYLGCLPARQMRRRPRQAGLIHGPYSCGIKSMEIRIDRIDMHPQGGGNLGCTHPIVVKQKGLGTTSHGTFERFLNSLKELTYFSGTWFTNIQRAGHG